LISRLSPFILVAEEKKSKGVPLLLESILKLREKIEKQGLRLHSEKER
jgi:hypothetical protein